MNTSHAVGALVAVMSCTSRAALIYLDESNNFSTEIGDGLIATRQGLSGNMFITGGTIARGDSTEVQLPSVHTSLRDAIDQEGRSLRGGEIFTLVSDSTNHVYEMSLIYFARPAAPIGVIPPPAPSGRVSAVLDVNLVSIPEPSLLGLASVGLFALTLFGRKR